MTALPHRSAPPSASTVDLPGLGDPAALARSVLACPGAVNLVVDGVDDVLADLGGPGGLGELGLQDLAGTPTFSAPVGARLVAAADAGRRALVTLESGLRTPGPAAEVTLTLGGRLTARGRETCECCADVRETVVLVVDLVVLGLPASTGVTEPVRVPVEEFSAPTHQLNAGYLQRSLDHANGCHHEELRRAVATATGMPLSRIIGAALADLTTSGVALRWVDVDGSHTRPLVFRHAARDAEELGDLLRDRLHPGLC